MITPENLHQQHIKQLFEEYNVIFETIINRNQTRCLIVFFLQKKLRTFVLLIIFEVKMVPHLSFCFSK